MMEIHTTIAGFYCCDPNPKLSIFCGEIPDVQNQIYQYKQIYNANIVTQYHPSESIHSELGIRVDSLSTIAG